MSKLTKEEYIEARRVIRNNGNYGIRFLQPNAIRVMRKLAEQATDKLAERAGLVHYCRSSNLHFTFNQIQ
jgi:hypothetical protein